MDTFAFYTAAKIIFGRGEFSRIGELAAGFGHSALVIANGGDPGDGGAVDGLMERLSAAGVQGVFVRQRGEPTVEDADRGVEAARDAGCEVVIGLGGGSALDAAKAVAALLANGGRAIDYMEVIGAGRKVTKRAAPWIAVPTTAGTGAEVTRNAVLACPEKKFKASLRGEQLLARVALVDAELGLAVPADVTARAGMDALCQLVESYTSNRANPVTDALAAKGIALAARSLARAVADGGDLGAREDMALAALLSGMTLTGAGLGAVHGFAAPLGANFPVPHGTVCANLLPHVIAANVQALRRQDAQHPTLSRYAEIGRTLTGQADLEDAPAANACAPLLRELICDLGIPRLGQFGLTERDVPDMVALARRSSSMRYNPVELSDGALAEVLRKAV